MTNITDETKQQIHRLRASGIILREIAEATGCNEAAVYRVLMGRKTYPCVSCGGESTSKKSKCRKCYNTEARARKPANKCVDCNAEISARAERCVECQKIRKKYLKRLSNQRHRNYAMHPTLRCTGCGGEISRQTQSQLCRECFLKTQTCSAMKQYKVLKKPRRCSCGAIVITSECVACDARNAEKTLFRGLVNDR